MGERGDGLRFERSGQEKVEIVINFSEGRGMEYNAYVVYGGGLGAV